MMDKSSIDLFLCFLLSFRSSLHLSFSDGSSVVFPSFRRSLTLLPFFWLCPSDRLLGLSVFFSIDFISVCTLFRPIPYTVLQSILKLRFPNDSPNPLSLIGVTTFNRLFFVSFFFDHSYFWFLSFRTLPPYRRLSHLSVLSRFPSVPFSSLNCPCLFSSLFVFPFSSPFGSTPRHRPGPSICLALYVRFFHYLCPSAPLSTDLSLTTRLSVSSSVCWSLLFLRRSVSPSSSVRPSVCGIVLVRPFLRLYSSLLLFSSPVLSLSLLSFSTSVRFPSYLLSLLFRLIV